MQAQILDLFPADAGNSTPEHAGRAGNPRSTHVCGREKFLAQLAAVDEAALESVVCKRCGAEPVVQSRLWEDECGDWFGAHTASCSCTDGPTVDDEMDALASWAELTDSDADWCERAQLALADGTGRVLRTATHEEVEGFMRNDRQPIEVAGIECVITWGED